VTGDLGPARAAPDQQAYARLIADLDASGARDRLIEHAPEGRTELVSALRGHDLALAAKCLILLVHRRHLTTRARSARINRACIRARELERR
jgi:Ala-tRNA(Pro) deacylase